MLATVLFAIVINLVKFMTWYNRSVNLIPSFVIGSFLSAASMTSFAEDEIFLAELKLDNVVSVINISDRVGYDNQPHFTPDNNAILYTAMFTAGEALQSDSMFYDIASKTTLNLTQSAASEYSPTVTPDGEWFSVIYVGDDGRQRLSKYPLKGGKPQSLITKLDSKFTDIGYQIWLDEQELLLFVLAEPMQLQRVNINTGKASIIDTNIGRTLRSIPNSDLYSYNKALADKWQMQFYDKQTNTIQKSVTLPGNAMYYAWHSNGNLLTALGNKVMINDVASTHSPWQQWHDFSKVCADTITRMAMSSDQRYLAFVCNSADNQ